MCLEEQREHRQKLQNQESRRNQLDTSLRLKMKRLAQEQQEELALDMSILEQLLTNAKDEKKEEALRKVRHQSVCPLSIQKQELDQTGAKRCLWL